MFALLGFACYAVGLVHSFPGMFYTQHVCWLDFASIGVGFVLTCLQVLANRRRPRITCPSHATTSPSATS